MKLSFVALAISYAACSLHAAEPQVQPTTNEVIQAVLEKARREMRRSAYKEAISTTTGIVKIDPKNAEAYRLRGQAHEELREHEQAVADFSEVLKLAPDPATLQHRGFEFFRLARIKEAVADFDKFLELMPAAAAGHWQRGIALYYAGRFEDGRKQFELHQTANSQDVENAVWHFLCAARSAGIEKARASLIEIREDRRVPMAQIHKLFAGKGSTQDVLAAAEAGQPPAPILRNHLFYAHLYLALYYEATGNAKLTEEHLLKATGPYAQEHYMGDVARVHLKLLQSRKRD